MASYVAAAIPISDGLDPATMAASRWELREQVLANARSLWPLVEKQRVKFGRASSARDLPQNLNVVSMSGGSWCTAAIVYGGEVSDGEVARTFLFAESERFLTEREALYALLAVTQKRLYDVWSHVYLAKGTTRQEDGKGYGSTFE